MVTEATRPQQEAIENVSRNLETRLEDIFFRLGGMADTGAATRRDRALCTSGCRR